MHTPIEEVTKLLDQIRAVSHNPVIERCSDQIEVMCRGYMPDSSPNNWLNFNLTNTEARVMNALFATPGRLLSRSALMDAMYFDEPGGGPETKIVDIYICKLRSKLKGTDYTIETIWGRGYKGIVIPAQPNAMAA